MYGTCEIDWAKANFSTIYKSYIVSIFLCCCFLLWSSWFSHVCPSSIQSSQVMPWLDWSGWSIGRTEVYGTKCDKGQSKSLFFLTDPTLFVVLLSGNVPKFNWSPKKCHWFIIYPALTLCFNLQSPLWPRSSFPIMPLPVTVGPPSPLPESLPTQSPLFS